MPDIDIAIEADWPSALDWADIAFRAGEAAAEAAPELGNPRLSVSLLFADDAMIHELNRDWRARDKATNVLSFPMIERDQLVALSPDGPEEMLGDIALALETCAREAADKGVALEDHAAHLIVHGLLHLAGHDHELGEAEAEAMEGLERFALAKMGIADPYA